MTELCVLAQKYGTDKCPQIGHNFTPYYYELFSPLRHKTRKVVELGIGHPACMWEGYEVGASLRMWRDFFPEAEIVGIDIEERCQFQDTRITTYRCNQIDLPSFRQTLELIGNDIDIFIDDGLHVPDAQTEACLTAMPFIKKEGIYVIEDVVQPDRIVRHLARYKTEVVTRNTRKFRNDRLIVVRHG